MRDGRVVAAGDSSTGVLDVTEWRDVVAVVAGSYHTVGLTSGGQVMAAGNNHDGQCDVSDWSDIIAVAAGSRHDTLSACAVTARRSPSAATTTVSARLLPGLTSASRESHLLRTNLVRSPLCKISGVLSGHLGCTRQMYGPTSSTAPSGPWSGRWPSRCSPTGVSAGRHLS